MSAISLCGALSRVCCLVIRDYGGHCLYGRPYCYSEVIPLLLVYFTASNCYFRVELRVCDNCSADILNEV